MYISSQYYDKEVSCACFSVKFECVLQFRSHGNIPHWDFQRVITLRSCYLCPCKSRQVPPGPLRSATEEQRSSAAAGVWNALATAEWLYMCVCVCVCVCVWAILLLLYMHRAYFKIQLSTVCLSLVTSLNYWTDLTSTSSTISQWIWGIWGDEHYNWFSL